MKTLSFILVATLFCITTANAQITKGNWLMGGDMSLYMAESKSEHSDSKSTSLGFTVNPTIGYFFIDNLAGGLTVIFGFNSHKEADSKSIGFSTGPFVRYYFLEPEKQINIFAQTGYGFGRSFLEGNTVSKSSVFDIRTGPVFFLNSSVAIELMIIYNYSKSNNTITNNIQMGAGFQIHLEKYNIKLMKQKIFILFILLLLSA